MPTIRSQKSARPKNWPAHHPTKELDEPADKKTDADRAWPNKRKLAHVKATLLNATDSTQVPDDESEGVDPGLGMRATKRFLPILMSMHTSIPNNCREFLLELPDRLTIDEILRQPVVNIHHAKDGTTKQTTLKSALADVIL